MHPFVASVIVNEINHNRAEAARHARLIRRRQRRATVRRATVAR